MEAFSASAVLLGGMVLVREVGGGEGLNLFGCRFRRRGVTTRNTPDMGPSVQPREGDRVMHSGTPFLQDEQQSLLDEHHN